MPSDNWLPSLWNDKGGDRSDPFRALRKQMDEVFNDWSLVVPKQSAIAGQPRFQPSVDVSETDKDITIVAELPGIEQKDVELALVGNQLTIKGEKRTEAKEEKDDKGRVYHRVERSYGAFQRMMSLPFEIDAAKVDAKFKDGVLTVVLPKPPEVQKQSRKIEINKAS